MGRVVERLIALCVVVGALLAWGALTTPHAAPREDIVEPAAARADHPPEMPPREKPRWAPEPPPEWFPEAGGDG